ncbi:MAG TPA: peptidase MA family metallohydrolase [Candidatus Omnitrophota bacterium]|nr:peptidase MA family metallohydrolase [Candidatus Omnitrophota bacterium]
MKQKATLLALILLMASAVPVCAQEWKEYSRQHFIVYYKEAPLDFVKTVDKAAEDYYVEISENLGVTRDKGWSWENRAKIYIYNNADDYVASARQSKWSSGAASTKEKTIRTFPSAHGFFDSTLPHELAHIIFREFVGFQADIPSWFEEGVAMHQEKAKRWGAHDTVRKAMKDGTFRPLSQLTMTRLRYGTGRDLINLFYAEAASVVNFMIHELGDQQFIRLCKKLKDGESFASALDSVYVRFKTVDDLNEAWVKYLKNE